ncbi:MAG: hypothetical protein JSV32_01745 [Dehalococcoidia bacterium]|nr:MAG: hypothetical protein JSV32_01745 [Dehalococcoidia bacterium]
MKKCRFYVFFTAVAISILCAIPACGNVNLGEEFSLSIGQMIVIADEDLEITFVEVISDNRCARDVICITEGSVVCKMRVVQDESSFNIELAQPGLFYDYSQRSFGGYIYTFQVVPYPESEKTISTDEYRILLTINK